MFTRILVATDFSPHADAAWRFALDLARVHRACTVLLHVALEGALREFPERTLAEDEYLKRIGDDLAVRAFAGERAGVAVQTSLRAGDPAPVIAETARDENADIIIVGTHAQRFANPRLPRGLTDYMGGLEGPPKPPDARRRRGAPR